MATKKLHIFTRTPLHVGAGSSVGAIDMPIQRERHTQIPIIPGSSLKGVLRGLWTKAEASECDKLFGPESSSNEHKAGDLLIGEARVLCFPVRSARHAFAWITSPLAIMRYAREIGSEQEVGNIPQIGEDQCRASGKIVLENKKQVVLEEYCFSVLGEIPEGVLKLLKAIMPENKIWQTLAERLVLVSDDIFSHFCATACEVQQRIRIDDETGTVAKGALFNQENVPSETLFYAIIGERTGQGNTLEKLSQKLSAAGNMLQIGGDETIGLGFCSVELA